MPVSREEVTDRSKRLPRVVASSVIRSAHKGESHGGVYLVDLETEGVQQVIDWDRSAIDWEGRGGDRGLRGIAFWNDLVYLAASDEIFIYDRHFQPHGSIRTEYLKHCHEIFIAHDTLYMTSTGFDSIIQYDMEEARHGHVFTFRTTRTHRALKRIGLRLMPRISVSPPDTPPTAQDTSHLNSVVVEKDTMFIAGTRLGHLLAVTGSRMEAYAPIPYGSHNARPFGNGVIMNHTPSNRVCLLDRRGRVERSYPIPQYAPDRLKRATLSSDHARQAFARGLAIFDDEYFVAGSSPATISLYRFDRSEPLKTINLTMDVRNAIHGLEVWPFS